jgi:hypothetical protein
MVRIKGFNVNLRNVRESICRFSLPTFTRLLCIILVDLGDSRSGKVIIVSQIDPHSEPSEELTPDNTLH